MAVFLGVRGRSGARQDSSVPTGARVAAGALRTAVAAARAWQYKKASARSKGTAMPQARNVAVIVGSLRKDSMNRKLALNLAKLAPDNLKLNIAEIGNLPLYNQDDDANPPAPSVAFKQQIQEADAVLFVTPEYNRSVPGVLKNAIDIASRPYGKSAWDGKPGAVVSLSPGAVGGFGANHHLRQSLVFLNVPVLQQPEAYIGHGGDLFDESGNIKKPDTQEFLRKFLNAFAGWIDANPAKLK
jgi:chromate reductase, NAD(P)H dehydrogenase (quinone)